MTFEEILRQQAKENQKFVCEVPAYLYDKKQGEFTSFFIICRMKYLLS